MASRSNLSGRPGPSGVLNRVMNPLRRSGPKVTSPGDPDVPGEVAATPEIAAQQGGGALSGMVARAMATQKERQSAVANRAVKPQAPPQSPAAGPKRGPRRRPTAREQAGLAQVGASQRELAGEAQPMSRRASLSDRMARAQGTLAEQTAEAEVGGTRTENSVTEPSLNRSRRPRAGRTPYRR